jgi:hypothetical protein
MKKFFVIIREGEILPYSPLPFQFFFHNYRVRFYIINIKIYYYEKVNWNWSIVSRITNLPFICIRSNRWTLHALDYAYTNHIQKKKE